MDWKCTRIQYSAKVVDKGLKPRIYKPTETDFSTNGLGILRDTTRADVREGANGVYELELEHPLLSRFAEYFENGYQIKVKPNDSDDYHIFEIKRTYKDTIGNNILIYAQSRTYRLGNRQVQHVAIESCNGSEAMQLITAGMDASSDIKLFSDITTRSSTTFEARNVLNCIAGEQGSLLQYWGGEIKREPFKLSLLRRRGRDNVGVVRYGKDLTGLKITFDWQSIITRCLPYADLQDGNDGKTKRIYGKKVDSSLINNYPDIYARYVQFTEEQGVHDLDSLNKVAGKYFSSTNPGVDKPKVSIELEVDKLTDSEEAKEFARLRNYGLFDTFSVYHKLYDIYVEAKITEVVYDSLLEKTKRIVAGDAKLTFYQQQNNDMRETIKALTKKGYMSEFVDYITDLINGVEGGSVLQYPKNRPHTTYYMDTDSRETAKDVIAINNQGIGFSRDGWRGPFRNAWSIDGILNADFILTGKIIAAVFETSFNALGDQLKLVAGALQAWNNSKKIMELTKKGMQFWGNSKEIGTIGTTDSAGNPFPDTATPTPIEENAIVIRANGAGKYILISPVEGKGLVMLGNGNAMYVGDFTNQGDFNVTGDARIFGNLNVSGDVNIVSALKALSLEITNTLKVNGRIDAAEYAEFAKNIRVNGLAATERLTASDSLNVGNNAIVGGRLNVKELYVNGVKIDTNGSGSGGPSGGDLTIFVKVLALTAKYEMGDRSSGYYHEPLNDGAGWNYGKYSFTQAYEMTPFLAWLATNYPSIRSALVGSVGTSEFNNSWAAFGAANETLFTGVQAEYFCRQKLKPMIEHLKSSTGVDLNDGNKWLGTLSIFCSITNWYPAAVQSGFFYNFVQQFASSWNDSSFITTVCDYIVANASSMVAPEYVQGIQNRFRAEKVDALALTTPTKIPFETQAIGGYRIPIAKPITVTSEFGMRVHPITGVLQLHNGIDLVNGNPNTPILASNAGKVVQASSEYFDYYGNYVVIQHADGLYTGYAHLSRIDVSAGQTVSAGQQLGLMGTTGPSTGEHLHFQLMKAFWPSSDDDFVNPRTKITI